VVNSWSSSSRLGAGPNLSDWAFEVFCVIGTRELFFSVFMFIGFLFLELCLYISGFKQKLHLAQPIKYNIQPCCANIFFLVRKKIMINCKVEKEKTFLFTLSKIKIIFNTAERCFNIFDTFVNPKNTFVK